MMNSHFSKPFTLDRIARLVLGAVVMVVIFLVVKKLEVVLLPFAIAWLLAYIINPMVHFVQVKMKVKYRTPSILIVIFSIIGAFLGITILFAPKIISEVYKFKDFLFKYIGETDRGIIPHSWENILQSVLVRLDVESIMNFDSFAELVKGIYPHAAKLVSNSISFTSGLFIFFIVLLYLFFILKDYQKVSKEFLALVPSRQRPFITGLATDIEKGMNQYFRGQALIAFIVGILFCVGFSIIGMPLAIIMGLTIGFLNLVPYLQVVGILPSVLLVLLDVAENGGSVWLHLLALTVVFVVVQLIQDAYLVPKIMGKKMGLNPALILLSLSIWGYVMGMMGMIIALPFTTLIISYYKRFVLMEPESKPLYEEEENKEEKE